jgi:hypothetical protein
MSPAGQSDHQLPLRAAADRKQQLGLVRIEPGRWLGVRVSRSGPVVNGARSTKACHDRCGQRRHARAEDGSPHDRTAKRSTEVIFSRTQTVRSSSATRHVLWVAATLWPHPRSSGRLELILTVAGRNSGRQGLAPSRLPTGAFRVSNQLSAGFTSRPRKPPQRGRQRQHLRSPTRSRRRQRPQDLGLGTALFRAIDRGD